MTFIPFHLYFCFVRAHAYLQTHTYIHTERKQNQNRKWIGKKNETFFHSVLPYFWESFPFAFSNHLPLSPSSAQLQPRHHNIDNFLRHHIIVNSFSMKQIIPKPLLLFLFYLSYFLFLSNQLPNIYPHFQNKKYFLMKPDTFDFKSLPTFPVTTIPPPLSSHTFK